MADDKAHPAGALVSSPGDAPIRLYLSESITGDPYWRARFNAAATALRAAGYGVVSPSDQPPETDDALTWEQHMRRDIAAMMDCDGVSLLPGWDESRGATMEYDIARNVGLRCRYVEDWLAQAEGAEEERGA